MADEPSDEPKEDVLQLAYRQICASYADITDFRGKLLALLPLATGTGAFLLLERKNSALGPIGLFGVAVTLGLFMYELRGMQRCHRLEDQAKRVEKWLGLDVDKGPFVGQPERSLGGMLGPPAAGLFVYLAVVFAWLYVAGVGYDWWREQGGRLPEWGLVVAYAVVLLVAWVAVRTWWPSTWKPPWPETPEEIKVLELEGTKVQAFDEHKFTGAGERRELLALPHADMRIGWISFQDGASTNWHRHDGEQILFVLSGKGCIGTGSTVLAMRPSDVVRIPAGARHWHGAQSGEDLVHLAITRGTETKWPESPDRPNPCRESGAEGKA